MNRYIIEWNDKRVLAQIEDWVVSGMEAACEFAARRAEGYAPQRTGKLRRDIAYTYKITAKNQDITGYIGVQKGKKRAFYAYFVEYGTRKMAARPFLRPAVFNHAQEIVRLVARGGR